MGELVTPHAEISGPRQWRFLACGVDTLDLALNVDWSKEWIELSRRLRRVKAMAQQENKPIPFPDSPFLVYPTGKSPNYAYHLEDPDAHLFVADMKSGDRCSNVYASVKSKKLWSNGIRAAGAGVVAMVNALDPVASITAVKPSRCDLCADFHVPGGLRLDFLRACGVPDRLKTNAHMKGNVLETYYVGASAASVRARIYNKSLEIQVSRKFWLYDVWGEQGLSDVWRCEFQIRRTALRQYQVNTLSDLERTVAGIWQNLTNKFYSLRLLDNPNVTRRTVHPWWADVQGCAFRFGLIATATRDLTAANPAALQFYVTRAANCFLGFAALTDAHDPDEGLRDFTSAIKSHWEERNFSKALTAKRIEQGEAVEGIDDSCGYR
jgi:hypothetical protein